MYYPTGGAICRMLNKTKESHKIRCNVEATGGSVYNVNALSAKELDLGIAQSDVVFKAWNGEAPFKKKVSNLRSVFSIHPEAVTLVSRKDASIRKLMDLKGKKINVGNPGSGQRRSVRELFGACKIQEKDLALVGALKAAEMPDALRDKKLDAYFYTVGHPTANIQDIATSIDIQITPLTGRCVDKLVESRPYYVKSMVPGGLYRGVRNAVPTIGLKATLMANKDVSENVIYNLVKSVFDNLKDFQELHPAYKNLTQKTMLEGLVPPFHPGAEKYFREKGLL